MKAICLLLILANISLFLWEYREGGLNGGKGSTIQSTAPGVATILLVNEVEQASELVAPEGSQPEPGQGAMQKATAITQPESVQPATSSSPGKADKANQEPAPRPKTGLADTRIP